MALPARYVRVAWNVSTCTWSRMRLCKTLAPVTQTVCDSMPVQGHSRGWRPVQDPMATSDASWGDERPPPYYGRKTARGWRAVFLPCETFLVQDLDAGDFRVVGPALGEGEDDLAARVGGGRRLLDDRLVLRARRREDVEGRQPCVAVDRHVELALTSRRPGQRGEVQADRVGRPSRQTGDRVVERGIPANGLVDRRGGRVGDARRVDRVGAAEHVAGVEVGVGRERRDGAGATGVDLGGG